MDRRVWDIWSGASILRGCGSDCLRQRGRRGVWGKKDETMKTSRMGVQAEELGGPVLEGKLERRMIGFQL